jgi:uncharacterized protein
MIIDVSSLDRTHGRVTGEVGTRIEDPVAGECAVPCRVVVDYRRTSGTLHFHGAVSGRMETVCHRCLDPVSTTIAGDFDIIVRRGEHELGDAEDVITLAPNEHEVSLDAFVHETVVVNAPMIVVCSERCKGLCATCGTNLNRSSCSCAPGRDPRWDALRKLKMD